MSADKKNLSAYNNQASALAASYNTLVTPDILPDYAHMIKALPDPAAARVLDLGCGSGRDAFWAAQQGVSVVAVDGAADMLAQARKDHAHHLINYLEDYAPRFDKLRHMNLKFDIVLMGAFLFHFNENERQTLYSSLKPLLRDPAQMFVTLRHGPVPEGRVMHHVPLQELEDFARGLNGASHFHGLKDDPLNRPCVRWSHVSLKL